MKALAKDTNSGEDAIKTFTAIMDESTFAASKNKDTYIGLARTLDNITNSDSGRITSQGKVSTAIDGATSSASSYGDQLERINGLQLTGVEESDPEIAVKAGEEYLRWLLQGVRNYAKEDG
jgi:hypothetical protein